MLVRALRGYDQRQADELMKAALYDPQIAADLAADAEDAKRAELNSKRRTDILTRQEVTAGQQQARMDQTSKVKTPRMTAPSATDTVSIAQMPTASGKGTAYDTWRSTVYGG